MALSPDEKQRRKEERKKLKFEKEHKIINGIDHKFCNKHKQYFPNENEYLPATLDYFYANDKNSVDGLLPYCKRCNIEKSMQQFFADPKKNIEAHIKYQKTRKYKDRKKHQREHIKEYQKNYRKQYSIKINGYSSYRQHHKYHKINKKDLAELYEYANNSCMYCGMTELEHKEKYGTKLHKDHAINKGNNGIENCVLACKGCNCSKNIYDWNEWYTPDNPIYKEEYYIKLDYWLNHRFQKSNAS